ncbi:MAG: hypothetical protein ACREQA_20375 [Candidatus Binatia bacterium]
MKIISFLVIIGLLLSCSVPEKTAYTRAIEFSSTVCKDLPPDELQPCLDRAFSEENAAQESVRNWQAIGGVVVGGAIVTLAVAAKVIGGLAVIGALGAAAS